MSLLNNPSFTIQDASKRGQDLYEVLFDRWGVVEDPAAPVYDQISYPALGEPGIPLSIAGLAIGPRSTVDRAWVTYNLQKTPNDAAPSAQTDRVRRLSLDSPLYFTQAGLGGKATYAKTFGRPDAFYEQYAQGHFYVYAASRSFVNIPVHPLVDYSTIFPNQQETTVLPATVLKAGSSATAAFGPSANVPDARTVWIAPLLHLYLYLKQPLFSAPPATRFPAIWEGPFTISGPEENTEICIAQVPIMGRKKVKISARYTTNGVGFTLRTAVVRAISQEPTRAWEQSSQSITTGPDITADLDYLNPCGDYLMVYVTCTLLGTGKFAITAYD